MRKLNFMIYTCVPHGSLILSHETMEMLQPLFSLGGFGFQVIQVKLRRNVHPSAIAHILIGLLQASIALPSLPV